MFLRVIVVSVLVLGCTGALRADDGAPGASERKTFDAWVKDSAGDDASKLVTLFTDANVEFSGVVNPGDRVTVHGNVVFFRRRKLRSQVEMRLEDGSVVCSGVLAGMGVPR